MTGLVRGWAPPVLWAAVLFVASSRSNTGPVDLGDGRDKLAHFVAYAVLGLLLARAQALSGLRPWVAVALGLAYAASDELHQSFVPGRSAEIADFLADALGVMAAVAIHNARRSRAPGGRGGGGNALADSVRT